MMRHGGRLPRLNLKNIAHLPLLSLDLDGYKGTLDLEPLKNHERLTSLDLRNVDRFANLEYLASCPHLSWVGLSPGVVPNLQLEGFRQTVDEHYRA